MIKIKNKLQFLFSLFVVLGFLSACSASLPNEPLSISSFKLNTIITITLYDSKEEKLLDECLAICDDYELLFSRTNSDSELYKINHGQQKSSPEIRKVLEKGLSYAKLSDGYFDVTLAPLTDLWDFNTQSPSLPNPHALTQALKNIGYQNVRIEGEQILFAKKGMGLDFGAIAKGYIADRLKEYLIANGVKSAMINLGGNVLCIGTKPNGEPFRIGIQKPFADRSETIATMDINDKSVVSSGIYERFFEVDGKQYHHILDPKTGYPYENGLIAVTIVSDESVDGDALSTTCFALGLTEGMALIESLNDVDAVFITKDGSLHYSKDFEEKYAVQLAP